MGGIGDAFEWRVEEQGEGDEDDGEEFDGEDDAEEHIGVGLDLIFVGDFDLSGGAAGDEDDAGWRATLIGVYAGDEVFGVGHFASLAGNASRGGAGTLGSLCWT